jgi:pyruvate carboxylase
LAIYLVSHGMTVAEFSKLGPDHELPIPNSVVDMFSGSLGVPEGGWPSKIQKIVLRGKKPDRGRPGARLEPADFGAVKKNLEGFLGREPLHDEVLSYLMYPDVFTKFARLKQEFGDVEVLPTPAFFYGMERGDEITVELEAGKSLVIKFLAVGDARADGHRTIFFELNGQPREVDLRDRSLEVKGEQRQKADVTVPGQVGAPLPGVVTTIAVAESQEVKKGDRLLVIEAMKMQSTVYAPIAGKVVKVHAKAGQQVESKDLLITIQ